MKQSEKLDLILKQLYDFKFDGRYYDIAEILSNKGCEVSFDEAFSLGRRLQSEGLIKFIGTKDGASATLTSEGVEYSESDSYTFKGSAVITNHYDIKIVNSPGSNVINQSSNVNVGSRINDLESILTELIRTIEKDKEIDATNKQEICELEREVRNNLSAGYIPKNALKSLMNFLGNFSSLGSFVIKIHEMLQ